MDDFEKVMEAAGIAAGAEVVFHFDREHTFAGTVEGFGPGVIRLDGGVAVRWDAVRYVSGPYEAFLVS